MKFFAAKKPYISLAFVFVTAYNQVTAESSRRSVWRSLRER